MTQIEEIKNAANEYCKNIDYSDYADIDVYDAFIAGVKWADAHQPSPWISVEERLPECNQEGKSEYCLIRRFDGGLYAARYLAYRDMWAETDSICDLIDGITHWMPIPKLNV